MEIIPVIAILVLAAVGFCLMLSAFVLSAVRHGPQPALPPGAVGPWPLWRRLFFAGAMLVMISSMLLLCPFVVPWWDYSSTTQVWLQGLFVGIGLGILYGSWLARKIMQERGG